MWQDVHQIQVQGRSERWWYQGQEGPRRERRRVGAGTARDRKLRAGWEGQLRVQVHEIEYVEVPEGTRKGEWRRRQAGGLDVWVTGEGEAVLQLQHREYVATGWGAERAVQMRTERAVWSEPGSRGRYRVAARRHRWWGWHMTWQADKGEGVPVGKEWEGELPGGGQDASGVRAQFSRAALAPAPTTQGHRGQELVYTFSEEMTLKAAEAIKMVLDEGRHPWPTARTMCTRTQGNPWHYAFPGGFQVYGLILRVPDAFRPRGATWSGQVISSPAGPSGGPSKTHLLPGGGVPRVHRARSPVPPRLPCFATPRSVHQFAAVAAGAYPLRRPPNAWSPGAPELPGPCYWLVASGTPLGWRGGCLA